MDTAKPLIAILMAVYEPQMEWLAEQLRSLEAQSYPNIRLYIRDDCSPTVKLEDIEKCVAECIRSFPYTLSRNKQNLGSNRTFEDLTTEAQGEYLAYCDQDDIWLPEKLTVLQESIEREQAELICSDMSIINGEGKEIAGSITELRRRHVFRSGEGLADTLWYHNFASGCALLVRSEIAKAAVPFNPYMYYDHYITLYSANCGRVISLSDRLLQHREHGDNQSSSFQGVQCKADYTTKRVCKVAEATAWLAQHFLCDDNLRQRLTEGSAWTRARLDYLKGNWKMARTVWRYRRFSFVTSVFELAMPIMPEWLFRAVIWAGRKNYI